MKRARYAPLTYLACPYSSPVNQQREYRFNEVTKAASALIVTRGWNVFSPITHSHPLQEIGGLMGDWQTWKRIDTEYLRLSARLVVLTLEGWRDSVGVTAEISIANKLGIPVYYLRPGHRELTRTP